MAAGSQGQGFWMAFPEHPTGLSANPNIWSRRMPLGEFSGNVARSNDSDGPHVDNRRNQATSEPKITYYSGSHNG